MYVLKLHDSDLLNMKIACSANILVDWVRRNRTGDIDSYECGSDVTFVRRDSKEIGVIVKVEVLNG